MALTDLEALASRVRFDLASAGFTPVAPDHEDDPEGGLLVFLHEDHIAVSWGMHDRLSEAATDLQDAGRQGEDVVIRYETTRAAMHLALGSILNAFGYHARPHALGFGHIIRPHTQEEGICP
ncbi:hypothetical protein [Streptomyces albidoflavus]|uniref:hypothetical protein n=1 Tax=Streptomyces albidoflavus TaxID=1886 RepID=UPI0010212806|nr:hypothetical protein [Streptomyces albidoflavus]RZE68160.1 hypothetical protein C0Q99_31460 [Streptomyces albidoflavus]